MQEFNHDEAKETNLPKLPQGWTDKTKNYFLTPGEGIVYQKKVENGVSALIRAYLPDRYADLDDNTPEFNETEFSLRLTSPHGHLVEATRLRNIIIVHGGRHQFGNEFDELVKIAEACIGEAHN